MRRQRKPKLDPGEREVTFDFPGVERCVIKDEGEGLLLAKLKVLPLFQGQGIGTRVLHKLKRLGKPIRLYAVPDDPDRWNELVRFYEKNGFHEADDNTMQWP